MATRKEKLLKSCLDMEPQLFIQCDGIDRGRIIEKGAMKTDEDGHQLLTTHGNYLMDPAQVRVMINPEMSKETVIKLLDKIKDCIQENSNWEYETKEILKENKLYEFHEYRRINK